MAGKRGGYRKGGKQAYRMTARRKSALRKAQLVSARKRKRNGGVVKAGILAGGVAVGVYAGVKYNGQIKDVASSVKRKLSFNTPNNSAQHTVNPDVKLAQVLQNGATNAQAARQAAPVQPPNMNNTSTPAPSRSNGPAAKGVPGFGGAAKTPIQVPSAGAVIDPTPPIRTPFPAEHLPSKEQMLHRLGKTDASTVTTDDAIALSKLWSAEKLKGVKVGNQKSTKNVGYLGVYTHILDTFGLETKKAKKAQSQQQGR